MPLNSTITLQVDKGTPILFYRGDYDPKATYVYNHEYRDYVRVIQGSQKYYFTVKKRWDNVTGVAPVPGTSNERWEQASQLGFLAAGAITADMIDVESLVVKYLATADSGKRIVIDAKKNAMSIYNESDKEAVKIHTEGLAVLEEGTVQEIGMSNFNVTYSSCINIMDVQKFSINPKKKNLVVFPSFIINAYNNNILVAGSTKIGLKFEITVNNVKHTLYEYNSTSSTISNMYVEPIVYEIPAVNVPQTSFDVIIAGCVELPESTISPKESRLQLTFNGNLIVRESDERIELSPYGLQISGSYGNCFKVAFDEYGVLKAKFTGEMPDFPGLLSTGHVAYDATVLTTQIRVDFAMGRFQMAQLMDVNTIRVYHYIGHTNYAVNLTPVSDIAIYVKNQANDYFDVAFPSGTVAAYKNFHYSVFGNNI